MERDILFRLKIPRRPGALGTVAAEIGRAGALIGEIRSLRIGRDFNVREMSVVVSGEPQMVEVVANLRSLAGVEIVSIDDRALRRHEGGKIRTVSRVRCETLADLRDLYTPGVARVCLAIKDDPTLARKYTSVGASVAIVTNGTRVLGLGDIGPLASLPVMEGKSVLYDRFAGLSGVPLLCRSKDPATVVETVAEVASGFGGIHLEDIRVPDCFAIERALEERLDIPVMHDDQHGTAVVALAAILCACRSAGVALADSVVGVVGLGAAGTGIATLVMAQGARKVLGCDRDEGARRMLAERGGEPLADLDALMARAEVVIAVTGSPGLLRPSMVRPGSVILALSNPVPEILPDAALAAGARFAADGTTVNNALAYPGIFRGALAVRASRVNGPMKLAAARAIADAAEEGEIVPYPLDPSVHLSVARAVARAAVASGSARERGVDVDAALPPLPDRG
ncbi:MAG: NAD-dependent malic enzyme [Planctomycetes bacterium]|nr:NAD-dependent malic enzyme [Planctomycetota bacterium]